ncbi:RPA-related protein RADX-like [Colius striatus]|uniref:RPA-related protein RADX-like n=1 Tax=Colius striatus TaxID=57412 RepID=UPI002B1D3B9A|nr:RPA-related protein RADX-like [Colius striatus]
MGNTPSQPLMLLEPQLKEEKVCVGLWKAVSLYIIKSLTEFQHEDFGQDKTGQAVPDSLQSCTDREGMSDTPETEETGGTCDSWQSGLWAQVKDKLMKYLHHSNIFPESIPRKFDYLHKDLLMQQYNLHAAVHQPKETRTEKNITEFKSASGLGSYEVTVLGINHDVAMDVAFLPLFCPEDPHLFQLEDIQNDTLLSCMSCISACQHQATSHGGLRHTFPLSTQSDQSGASASTVEEGKSSAKEEMSEWDKMETTIWIPQTETEGRQAPGQRPLCNPQ